MQESVSQDFWARAGSPAAVDDHLSHNSISNAGVAVASVLFGITLVFFAIRAYTKLYLVRNLEWDDFTCSFGLLFTTGIYVLFVWVSVLGPVGKHAWDLKPSERSTRNGIIPLYITLVFINPVFLFIKSTFMLMYLQIFGPMRWLRISAYLGLIVIIGYSVVQTIYTLVIITPRPDETWIESWTSPSVVDFASNPKRQYGTVINILFDVYILLLPIMAILNLEISRARKVGVILIFMSGVVACLCSILSTIYRFKYINSQDGTYYLMPISLLAIAEMTIGIMCTCMPYIAKAYNQSIPAIKAKLGRSSATENLPMDDRVPPVSKRLVQSSNSSALRGKALRIVSHEEMRDSGV